MQPAVRAAAQSMKLNPRLAPQDLEAERNTSGACSSRTRRCSTSSSAHPDDFYGEALRKIFTAMLALFMRSAPIDVITLGAELRTKGELEAVGGPAYLAHLDACVPATGNLARYARILRDHARRRRIIETAHQVARDGYDQRGTEEEFEDSTQPAYLGFGGRKASSSRLAVVGTVMDGIEAR